jgi:hypothetical protein
MYEQARWWLRAEHEMKNAALLYMGLGCGAPGLSLLIGIPVNLYAFHPSTTYILQSVYYHL